MHYRIIRRCKRSIILCSQQWEKWSPTMYLQYILQRELSSSIYMVRTDTRQMLHRLWFFGFHLLFPSGPNISHVQFALRANVLEYNCYVPWRLTSRFLSEKIRNFLYRYIYPPRICFKKIEGNMIWFFEAYEKFDSREGKKPKVLTYVLQLKKLPSSKIFKI